MNLYTIEHDDGDPLPGIDGTLIHGPLPRAGDVMFHVPLDESAGPHKLRVLYVEHTLIMQATGTLAARPVVFVEKL